VTTHDKIIHDKMVHVVTVHDVTIPPVINAPVVIIVLPVIIPPVNHAHVDTVGGVMTDSTGNQSVPSLRYKLPGFAKKGAITHREKGDNVAIISNQTPL
jgi:hypothetical protein